MDTANNLPISCSILGIMPLSALFILFDFVVQNPHYADTRANLTLMDIVSGHFSQLEHVSAGSLPVNYLSEFAHIARRYVQELPTPPADTRPSTGKATRTTIDVAQPDASLETGVAGETVSTARAGCDWASKVSGPSLTLQQSFQTYETSFRVDDVEDMRNSMNFDGSICFDDFAGTADFFSDVDVRALFSSSFLI